MSSDEDESRSVYSDTRSFTTRVVDRGYRTRIQHGTNNTMVELDLPEDVEDSEIPTIEFPASAPSYQDQFQGGYDIQLLGREARTQFGTSNQMVIKRTVPKTQKSQAVVTQATVEPVQVSKQERQGDRNETCRSSVQVEESEETYHQSSDKDLVKYKQDTDDDLSMYTDVKVQFTRVLSAVENESKSQQEINLDRNKSEKKKSEVETSAMNRRLNNGVLQGFNIMMNSVSKETEEQHILNDPNANPRREDTSFQPNKDIQQQFSHIQPTERGVRSRTKEGFMKTDQTKTVKDTNMSGTVQFRSINGDYVIQTGPIIDIEVSVTYRDLMERGIRIEGSSPPEPIIVLTWTGLTEEPSVCTRWRLVTSSSITDLLSHVTSHVMAPFRAFVIAIFNKYEAQLQTVEVTDCFVFEFWYHGEDPGRAMISDKHVVQDMIQQMFLGAGKGKVDFSLDVSVDAETGRRTPTNFSITRESNRRKTAQVDDVHETPADVESLGRCVHRLLEMLEEFKRDTNDNFKTIRKEMKHLQSGHQKGDRDTTRTTDLHQMGIPQSVWGNPDLQPPQTGSDVDQRTDDDVVGFPTQKMTISGFQAYAQDKTHISHPQRVFTSLETDESATPDYTECPGPSSAMRKRDEATAGSMQVRSMPLQSRAQSDITMDGARSLPMTPRDIAAWQWEDENGTWNCYENTQSDKMNKEFTRSPNGTCLIQKEGKSFRVKFKDSMEERSMPREGSPCIKHNVRRTVKPDLKPS